jgi:hypothetical protein
MVKFDFLTELTELQDRSEVECRCAAVLWLFGFATRLFPELYKLVG